MFLLRAVALAVLLAGCHRPGTPPAAAPPASATDDTYPEARVRPGGPGRDGFGIRQLYASAPDGLSWAARWHERPRRFSGRDPGDPWFDADHGDATYHVPGDGTLRISGSVPRMYVHDPGLERQWRNVEITVYFRRVRDAGVPWGGMVSVARTNHGTTGDENVHKCDTRGVGARMRYDGAVDFEKETNHPQAHALGRKPQWAGGLPFGVWVGYKHVVMDLDGGRVRQELWIDEADGAGGGQFRLLNRLDDDGTIFGASACQPGLSPQLPLRAEPERAGSESGKPNITVYFRSDEVGPEGLIYKWASVREIAPPLAPAAP